VSYYGLILPSAFYTPVGQVVNDLHLNKMTQPALYGSNWAISLNLSLALVQLGRATAQMARNALITAAGAMNVAR